MYVTFALNESDKDSIKRRTDHHLQQKLSRESDPFLMSIRNEYEKIRQEIVTTEINKINEGDISDKTRADNDRKNVVDQIVLKITSKLDDLVRARAEDGIADPSLSLIHI